MKHKRLLSLLMALILALSLLPMSALAAEGVVAQIGENKYATLDEAVNAAADGAIIELLADATTAGLDLSKNLTIQAAEGLESNPTITFNEYGIALRGKSLTFKNVNVVMNGINSTPYIAEWNWMTICASKDASLILDNVNMTMDNQNDDTEHVGKDSTWYGQHAIYFCSNNKLDLTNGTVLTIKNYMQDALEWDGGDKGYNVNITNSTFISDHNRSGFTGTFYATIDNSTVKVTNSLGNGSNGTYYTIKNGSNVLFDGNRNWGISAWRIDMTNYSTLTATNNGYSGIWTRVLNVDENCTLDVEKNGNNASGFTTNAGIFYQGNGSYNSTLEKGATVTIKDNAGSGIYTAQGVCNMTIGSATITGNGTGTINVQNQKGATYGGGIYNVGTMVLDADSVILYNNHADTGGDDIYNNNISYYNTETNPSITFGEVGSDWYLDGVPDHCTDAIDGWYIDGGTNSSRWEAHSKPVYAQEYTVDGSKTATGVLALKAAHGLIPVESAEDWEVSKSKTATNLQKQSDGTYTSDVTLSLPSAEKELVSDVVFVLDKSTSAALEEQALQMLSTLKDRIEEVGAQVKVGVVIFNKVANVANDGEFFDLTTEYDAIETAIKQNISSGTNTHAGLLAGKAMLDADDSVDASRKYLIFVSDGITYMYDANAKIVPYYWMNDGSPYYSADPYSWQFKYGNNDAPGSWDTLLQQIGATLANETIAPILYDEKGTLTSETATSAVGKLTAEYTTSVDRALYYTYTTYAAAQQAGYHCYAMTATTTSSYDWASSFMNYLSGSKEVSFDDIQREIYYLLDADSCVVDYIGNGTDNKGNAYNFDFVNSADALKLTVGEETLEAVELDAAKGEDGCYGFGEIAPAARAVSEIKYPYVLHYFADSSEGANDEHFVWEINVPVSNFAPVQLTYTVKLTNPQTADGTYGQYDEYGSEGYKALYTNNSAILYPVDSNGYAGVPEYFPKPTVSYTVSTYVPTTPPALNKADHVAYIIGYPEDYETGEPSTDKTRWPVKPEGNITRAEVTTIFFRLLTDESRAEVWSQTNDYSDVSSSDWFNNAVSTMSNAGIVTGYPDGTFRPNAPITRAEFAAIAARFSEVVYNGGNSFTDVPENHWAANLIALAQHLGWINGYPDNTFRPDQAITRAEAMTLVNRVLERAAEAGHMDDGMIVWADNPADAWYYEAVQEATNSHEYTRTDEQVPEQSFNYENWTASLEVPDWAALEREWSTANSEN